MTRLMPTSPLLLGFEDLERLIDRTGKTGGDGYPPYNIERIHRAGSPTNGDAETHAPETLRITLAVAGFARDDLEIQLEDKQLTVRGKQRDDAERGENPREFIHRGIAARQFSRTFVLADGLEVKRADLANGLLSIDLVRLQPAKLVRTIAIG